MQTCDEIISTMEIEQRIRKLETLVTLLVKYINRYNINNAVNTNYLQLLSLNSDEALHRNRINYEVRNHVNHDDSVRWRKIRSTAALLPDPNKAYRRMTSV